MQYGIYLFATDYCADIAILAHRAETLGSMPYGFPNIPSSPCNTPRAYGCSLTGSCPSGLLGHDKLWIPLVALARASAVTTTLKLGTGICLVPECNPLRLAKEIATLTTTPVAGFCLGSVRAGSKKKRQSWGETLPTPGGRRARPSGR